MDLTTLQEAAKWVIGHGYSLMFVLMLIEGPAVTAAGAFTAVLGYFNIWIVFLLSILGNLIPDVIYYLIGFWGREKLIDKYGRYFRIKPEMIAYLEKLIHKNLAKALIVIKLVPLLATPGLIITGVVRAELKKYIIWSIIITVPSSVFFLIIGYYFGNAYDSIAHYLDYGEYLALIAIALFFIISYVWKKIAGRLAEKLERDHP